MLSANNFRRRVPAADSQPSITFEPQDDPKSELGSFSAVPSAESNFGNRYELFNTPYNIAIYKFSTFSHYTKNLMLKIGLDLVDLPLFKTPTLEVRL